MARATIKEALREASRLWLLEATDGVLKIDTVDLYIQTCERLLYFARAHQVTRLDDITPELAEAFIAAPGRDRRNNITPVPADRTRSQRRSAVTSLFTHARALGLTNASPFLNSPSIPRKPRMTGACLTERDISDLQFHAERGMPATRNAALLALLLAGLNSAETAAAATTDLDLSAPHVITRGSTRTHARKLET
ncbi:hypothetical protein ACIQVO_37045 [Streptomyces sp. NPDC101062]|uniref:hypothetical protein n=1 Tax=unclassified Streptomyces TaxID=2593676 RepID=UPI003818D2EF